MYRVRILFRNGATSTVYTSKFIVRAQQGVDEAGNAVGDPYNVADYSKRDNAESIEYLDLADVSLILKKSASEAEVKAFDVSNNKESN